MSKTEAPIVDGAVGSFLFGLGVALCLHYGRMGFMPLDQSIVWDAGWRMLQGQVPFRDFVTPTSVVPGALQAAVFAVAGVSWLAYCAHAAVANGLFAVAVFALLRGEGLRPAPAAAFGAASTVFYYPPFGVPYGDQHSFLFGLLALLLASVARRATKSGIGPLLWALVPALLFLGSLSKPVPVGFLLPAVGVLAVWPGDDRWSSRVLLLFAGAVVSVGVFVLVLAAGGADLALAWDYLVLLPLDSGGRRVLHDGWLADRVRALVQVGGRSGTIFPWAAVGASLVAVSGVAVLAARGGEGGGRARAAARPLVVALLLWAATVLFVGVTRNQARNGHALLPVVLGLLSASLAGVARAAAATGDSSPWRTGLARLAATASVALVVVSLHDAVRFDATVNATRMVHDGVYDPRRAAAARGELPPALDYLEWGLASTRYSPRELTALVNAVAAEPGSVLLVSDSLVVYALAGKPSINPNLWYDPGVSMPRPDDERRTERLESLFVERLERARPGLVVFDPPPGLRRFRLDMLPRVDDWLRSRRCATGRIGPFPFWRLCPDGTATGGAP